jgi:hypothetical protein
MAAGHCTGQFAFADSPGEAQRFYGVNLCFGAQYLPNAQADQLAERLVRIGYNAVRIHHYEGDLTQGQTNSTTLNPIPHLTCVCHKLDELCAILDRYGFTTARP